MYLTELIPFNKPYLTGNEVGNIIDAHARGKLSGDGYYTKLCSEWLESKFNVRRALLTHSCTGALEMAAMLAEIKPGDEVIMPSYTFVSTANAFVLRGGVPVFVDIKISDQNIDETQIEAAVTSRTKAIVVVHYGGVPCEMDTIMEIANRHGIIVIEDAAQAIFSSYKERQLGTIGHMGCFSFHETKNVISGEGGALLINDDSFLNRAEVIREKGTDRSRFFRGQVDKYTWQDIGSSYLPGEIISAFLWAQLEEGEAITARRKNIWQTYLVGLLDLSRKVPMQLPLQGGSSNAHMFQIILPDEAELQRVKSGLGEEGVVAVTHYVPLHSSPKGLLVGKSTLQNGSNTDKIASGLLRLPLFPGLEIQVNKIIDVLYRLY
jgi:dTDP-4-amino-4,6-dideoxygalactose transaminase